MNKQEPCCARVATQVARAEAEVARVARILARGVASETRHCLVYSQLEAAKRERAEARQRRIDHEAEHADQAVPA